MYLFTMALSRKRCFRNWFQIHTLSRANTSRLSRCHSSGQLAFSTGGRWDREEEEEEEEEGSGSSFSGCHVWGRKTGKERVVKTQLELKTVPWNVRATRPGSRKVRNPITLWFSSRKSWCNLIFLATHTHTRPLSFSSLLPTTQARNQN